jgi:hypothetical protein
VFWSILNLAQRRQRSPVLNSPAHTSDSYPSFLAEIGDEPRYCFPRSAKKLANLLMREINLYLWAAFPPRPGSFPPEQKMGEPAGYGGSQGKSPDVSVSSFTPVAELMDHLHPEFLVTPQRPEKISLGEKARFCWFQGLNSVCILSAAQYSLKPNKISWTSDPQDRHPAAFRCEALFCRPVHNAKDAFRSATLKTKLRTARVIESTPRIGAGTGDKVQAGV